MPEAMPADLVTASWSRRAHPVAFLFQDRCQHVRSCFCEKATRSARGQAGPDRFGKRRGSHTLAQDVPQGVQNE